MIIAWVLSMIIVIASLVGNLEHSTALQIRLLAIEHEAHAAFVAAENTLNQCEAQLHSMSVLSVPTSYDAGTACEVAVVDANATGELIRIRAPGSVAAKQPRTFKPSPAKQTLLESMVYRNKQDHTIERLSWRVLWSISQPMQGKPL
jgi:Tfp pilus assembly protein PilX